MQRLRLRAQHGDAPVWLLQRARDASSMTHYYGTSNLLQANWIHPANTERWLRRMAIGSTLNVCCGKSLIGDVRVDLSPESSRTEEGDLFNLRFSPLSFDTVICDPPFSYYVTGENRFRWIQDLARISRKRLIISVKANSIYVGRRNWTRRLFYMEDNAMFLRLFWVFDRRNGSLET